MSKKPKLWGRCIRLETGERIVAIVPERASGPGWSNDVTWVYIEHVPSGEFRRECIQPNERSYALHPLYATAAEMHRALLGAVLTEEVRGG